MKAPRSSVYYSICSTRDRTAADSPAMKSPPFQWQHYLTLTRLNRPIGIYLLLWPTLSALWIAAEGWPGWHLFLVFTVGTILTRSAGCVVNDLTDQKFDGQVKRTQDRVLATGDVDSLEAAILAGGLTFMALLLVLTTNLLTVALSAGAVLVAIIYPFMKRVTYLPQAFLGIAFSMGIPMAFSATTGSVDNIAWLLVIANLLWVVAYDTQYAMVDRDDDLKLGLKSTAILFADLDRHMIGLLQLMFLLTLVLAGHNLGFSLWYFCGLAIAAALLVYQHQLTWQRSREGCFKAFLNNHWVGLAIFAGIGSHYLLT